MPEDIEGAAAPSRRRSRTRRSTATAPAGVDVAAEKAAVQVAAADAVAAATKTAAKKSAAKKAAAKKSAAPAKKAAKKAAAKKSAAPAEAPAKKAAKKAAAKKTAATKPAAKTADDEPKKPKKPEKTKVAEAAALSTALLFQAAEPPPPGAARRGRKKAAAAAPAPGTPVADASADEPAEGEEPSGKRKRRRRGRRGRGGRGAEEAVQSDGAPEPAAEEAAGGPAGEAGEQGDDAAGEAASRKRRRRRRRRGGGGADEGEAAAPDDPARTVVHQRPARAAEPEDEVRGVRGSTRLEAKRQRRRDERASGRRRAPILTEAEFLARREAVERVMLVRQSPERTQVAVLEDGVLVEHYITRDTHTGMVGNVYLGRVQNVLPGMEAAFVDIGRGRNAVLYAGEVNYEALGGEGRPRRIELALKSGQPVLVQVTKDPIGHKGARLTNQISLPGRFMVYVPDGHQNGISRKLPDSERTRLKQVLKRIAPEEPGLIVRTAAEGATEEQLTRDLSRLRAQWVDIQEKAAKVTAPSLVYEEPDLVIRVIRDIFNEDFTRLVVQGDDEWDLVEHYLGHVAGELSDRAERWTVDGDLFAAYRVDEQLAKALDRKVWLPSGGSLVIDRTEAMVVVDVNTGKFTGAGSNLEETVTRNNLEAAEEVVRQLRLRDMGGIIVIDFVDMVLESNRDLVLRRLVEALGRDRTRHQVSEFTSLGLVQLTRKRVGEGLLAAFSETCPECGGRGVKITLDPFTPAAPGRRTPPRPEPIGTEAGDADEIATAMAGQSVEATVSDLGPASLVDEPLETVARRRRRRRPAAEPAGQGAGASRPAEPAGEAAGASRPAEPAGGSAATPAESGPTPDAAAPPAEHTPDGQSTTARRRPRRSSTAATVG
jgi:ribonuclease E